MVKKSICGLLLSALSTFGMQASVLAETVMSKDILSKDILAVQIRKQGFSCGEPASAVRDNAHSKPNEAVWVLTCEAATYRVRLVPKMAAEVMLQ